MSDKITVVVWASMNIAGAHAEEEIQIDKNDYDEAKDKSAFLQDIYDDFFGNLVDSGYYIKEDRL